MKKKNIKNNKKYNKGITLVALIITIIILLIISSVVTVNLNTGQEYRNYQKMCADISILEDEIVIYYRKNGSISGLITGEEIVAHDGITDEGEYYELNIREFQALTLNYGKGNAENKDIYIINTTTLEVYYLKGVRYENERYYRKYEEAM